MQDFIEHHNEISAKFVSILKDRMQYHCRALKGLDWKNDGLVHPTPPINSLIKETHTLYKVLFQILPFKDVNVSFNLSKKIFIVL